MRAGVPGKPGSVPKSCKLPRVILSSAPLYKGTARTVLHLAFGCRRDGCCPGAFGTLAARVVLETAGCGARFAAAGFLPAGSLARAPNERSSILELAWSAVGSVAGVTVGAACGTCALESAAYLSDSSKQAREMSSSGGPPSQGMMVCAPLTRSSSVCLRGRASYLASSSSLLDWETV